MKQPNNFWRIKMYPAGNTEWGEDHTPWILQNMRFIGMGSWDDGQDQIRSFIDIMKVGDIVGVVVKNKLLALVQVTDLAKHINYTRDLGKNYDYIPNEEDERLKWIIYRRPVRILDWNIAGMPEITQERSTTLVRCDNKSAPSNVVIIDWFEHVKESFKARGLLHLLS